MCGIAGLLDLSGRLAPERLAAIGRAMADTLSHRGPDDSGVWLSPDGHCVLAHRRLSILDTSAAGHQPMVSADGRHALSFNGELYNYQELRDELAGRGERYRGHSDTEVLLAGLIREQESLLPRLDAMFAFGFYDGERRALLLGRDAFGEKPLYYTHQNGLFAFASELQALTRLPDFDAGIEPDTIAAYLSLQYVPAPHSIYRSCRKLEPGSFLWVTAARGVGVATRYFSFTTSGATTSGAGTGQHTLDEQADALEELLVRALRRRLLSDVPLGAFLSGGVDSATVVALVARKLNRPIQTFSLGFTDTEETEHLQAREIARHLGTEHREHLVPVDQMALAGGLGELLDEPNADSSCLPTWLLSRFARQSVTVVLSGDGGDEMFGGYRRYFECAANLEAHRAEAAAGRWQVGWDYVSDRLLIFTDRNLIRLLGAMPASLAARLDGLRRDITADPRPLVNVLREVDAAHYLPGAVLTKVDRMSMRHGLEVRTPYLSIEVARFAAGLPADRISQGGTGKLVLKHLASRYLPEAWLARPKRGFGLPVRTWGAEEHLLGLLRERISDPASPLRQWIPPGRILDYFATRPLCYALYELWALVILECWLRSHPAVR